MRKFRSYAIWAMAALLSVFMIGCACEGDNCGDNCAGGNCDGMVWPSLQRPTVTFVSPFINETGVPVNWKISAHFSEAMDPTTISTSTFTLTGPGGAVLGTVTYDAITHTATFKSTGDLAPSTRYTATITLGALNLAGTSMAVSFVWSFTTGLTPDTIRPRVILVHPAILADGVPINTAINATFSEVMDPATITLPATFTLKQGVTPIAGTVTYVGLIATFIPSSPLAPNTTYTATITTAAQDLAGNAMASDFVWSFTTGAIVDTTRPTVILVNPANLAAGVPINTTVTATFSKAMNPGTIITANFILTGPGGIPVLGIVGYATLTNIATFIPLSSLASNTTYIATITTGSRDLAGNALANNFVWSFTTGSTVETVPPSLTGFPTGLNVALNTEIKFIFSEPMNWYSVNLANCYIRGLVDGFYGNDFYYVQGTAHIEYSTNTVIMQANPALLPSTTYFAGCDTGVMDVAGNHMAGPYNWSFSTGPLPDTTRPTVILVNPPNLAIGVPVATTVTATFSEAMKPTTIIAANFKLTGPGITPVTGIVGYNILTKMATFTPSGPLALNTTYTATITTGVQDLAGNAMLANYVWTFKTIASLAPVGVDLGAAANFVALSSAGITNIPTSAITGNIGVSPGPGSAIVGFSSPLTCPEVTGKVFKVDATGPACALTDAAGLTAAKAALTVAYNDAKGRTIPAPATVSGDQGGVTLAPGIYKSTSSLKIEAGNLTLDGQGDPNAVWIFQINSTLTTVGCGGSVPCATGGNVILKPGSGAKAANVYWVVGSSATIGQYTAFKGTILAFVTITVGTGAQIEGRLLAGAETGGSGAITLSKDTITLPLP